MRFHKYADKRFHGADPPSPPRNARFMMGRSKTLPQHRIKSERLSSELLSQEDGIADDSPMISASYEAHLSMEKMLAVFAQLRGDDAEEAIG